MGNIDYMTLADVRAQNPEQFDALIKQAWHDAAIIVGDQVLKAAFYGEDATMAKAA
jgi:hypothetical protein